MFLNVFLFQAEFFRRVKDEHLHADVGRRRGAGKFGHDDHQPDSERDSPDRGLFANDAQQRMRSPEGIKID